MNIASILENQEIAEEIERMIRRQNSTEEEEDKVEEEQKLDAEN